MSTTINYTNVFGSEITPQQASQIETYHETIVEEGQKRVNTFSNGSLVHTRYYISSQDEVEQFLTTNPNASFRIDSVLVNGYTVGQLLFYENNLLIGNTKFINDTSDNLICFQKYDPQTGSPLYLFTEKWYYDSNDETLYSFIYNEDGSCFSIDQPQISSTDSTFMVNEIGVNPEIDFTWEGFEYYQNAEPLIPSI